MIAFTALSGFMGALPPWYRYWYWLQPMGLVRAAVCIGRVPSGYVRQAVVAVVLVIAVIPNVLSW